MSGLKFSNGEESEDDIFSTLPSQAKAAKATKKKAKKPKEDNPFSFKSFVAKKEEPQRTEEQPRDTTKPMTKKKVREKERGWVGGKKGREKKRRCALSLCSSSVVKDTNVTPDRDGDGVCVCVCVCVCTYLHSI